jgi:hypothetical protein
VNSEWVRDNKRRLLFLKRTVNGRTRVYGKGEHGSGGHYGYEGYVDPNNKFIRRPDGERIGRGNHPDLIHAEAQRRRQTQSNAKTQVKLAFTDPRNVHLRVKHPVSVNPRNDKAAAEGIGILLGYTILLVVYSFVGLTGFGMLLNLLFLVIGIVGVCLWNSMSCVVVLAAIAGMFLVHGIAADDTEES